MHLIPAANERWIKEQTTPDALPPVIKYRVFYPNPEDPNKPWEDFTNVDDAWSARNRYLSKTNNPQQPPYVHPIRMGGSEFPMF
jgi:hypothetical protein